MKTYLLLCVGCSSLANDGSNVLGQVWALDVKRCVYVRVGVCPEFLCGTGWKFIPGNALLLCMDKRNALIE